MIMKNTIKMFVFNIIACLLLPVSSLGQTYMNGVYVKNGKTVEVDKKVHQFTPTNSSDVLYFSNELIVKVYTNSDFMVNSLFQDVLNKKTTPEKAKLGVHNFAGSLMNGTAVVTYSGGDSNNSSCIISTPMTDLELYKGTFYIKVNESRVLVFVLEGALKSHGDRNRENVVTAGYAVVAVPNDIGILEAKISLGSEKVKQVIIDKLFAEAKEVINLKGTIMFARIDGKLLGILID